MKLSEAIRLGSTLGPQAQGLFDSPDGSMCALGSAMKAVGRDYYEWGEVWPWMKGRKVDCPKCGNSYVFAGAIICLNDYHEWTRERIADWVATLEPAEVHASETIREVQSGLGPMRSPLEVETFETITK